MVYFVAFFKPPQNRYCILDGGLPDYDGLKPALQSRVLFYVFAVFVKSGRAYTFKLAARKHRLHYVCRVHGAFRRARAHECVHLVDEKYYLPVGRSHGFENRFQSLLELASVFGAGYERAHIQRQHATIFKRLGNVARSDAPRQPLGYGGFTDSGFADENGIIFRAAGKNLHHAPYLGIAAYYRVEFFLARKVSQVSCVFFKRIFDGLFLRGRLIMIHSGGILKIKKVISG